LLKGAGKCAAELAQRERPCALAWPKRARGPERGVRRVARRVVMAVNSFMAMIVVGFYCFLGIVIHRRKE
jgi:hypothetical protein